MKGAVYKQPGLHRRTGAWMVTRGIWDPCILIDPQTPTDMEHNFMVQHEMTHAQERHALRGLLLLVLLPVIGWFLYIPFRRMCEIRADAVAAHIFGEDALKVYCRMRKHPTSKWGKYLYGSSGEERIERTLKYMDKKGLR